METMRLNYLTLPACIAPNLRTDHKLRNMERDETDLRDRHQTCEEVSRGELQVADQSTAVPERLNNIDQITFNLAIVT